MRIAILLVTLILLSPVATAVTVYKYVDKHGNVVFGDSPVPGAQPIEVQRPATLPPTPNALPGNDQTAPPSQRAAAYNVTLTSPSNDAVYVNDPAPVVITGTSTPGLQPGHKYRLLMNGTSFGSAQQQPSFTLTYPDRGSYTVILQVVDQNLQPLQSSAPVTFHVKRPSRLFHR